MYVTFEPHLWVNHWTHLTIFLLISSWPNCLLLSSSALSLLLAHYLFNISSQHFPPCLSLAQPFILSVVSPLNISRLSYSNRILSVCHLHLVVLIEARVQVSTELLYYSVKLLSSCSLSTSFAVNFLSLQTKMKLQLESLRVWMSLTFHLMLSWPFISFLIIFSRPVCLELYQNIHFLSFFSASIHWNCICAEHRTIRLYFLFFIVDLQPHLLTSDRCILM